jgi:hypothetical protein
VQEENSPTPQVLEMSAFEQLTQEEVDLSMHLLSQHQAQGRVNDARAFAQFDSEGQEEHAGQ